MKLVFGETEIVQWDVIEEQVETVLAYCNEIREKIIVMLGDWLAESAEFLRCVVDLVN